VRPRGRLCGAAVTHGALVPRRAWLAGCALSFVLVMPRFLVEARLAPPGLLREELTWLPFWAAYQLIHVLTYPLAAFAEAVVLLLVGLGLATTSEALIAAWPLYVGLGYVQWFVVLPRLCERACRARPGR
jgi:hypothetical protein